MKPTSQTSHDQLGCGRDSEAPREPKSFPLTDYSFKATAEACGGSSTISQVKLRAFRDLSREFFGTEANRDYVLELLCFTLITGISAWPIISTLVAVARLISNY
jgi:hypothetical protein